MALENLTLRPETAEDRAAVFAVNTAAFGRPDEAKIVDALRLTGTILSSLVAELDGRRRCPAAPARSGTILLSAEVGRKQGV